MTTAYVLSSHSHPSLMSSKTEVCVNCKNKNFLIECACGCSEIIVLMDSWGYHRRFINHHQHRGHYNNNWIGGRIKRSDGYIQILRPNHPSVRNRKWPYVFEHRLVYEESRDCCLLDWIHVHHKDGNRSNNVWYNLQPLTNLQHKKLEVVRNIHFIESKRNKGIYHSEEWKRRHSEIMKLWWNDKKYKSNISSKKLWV
jgi:hypothetical protein